MSFKIYQYVPANQEYTDRGQCWRGEVIEEHLRELGLNSTHQTILPTIIRLLPKQGRILEAGFKVLLIEADDFIPPKSLGLYADWAWFIGNRHAKWELNTIGRILLRFLGLFPLWLYCSGILLVARK